MIKKIVLFLCISFCIACGSSKPVVRTTKSTTAKPVARTTKKPVSKTNTSNSQVSKTSTAVNQEKKQTSAIQSQENAEVLEATTSVKVTPTVILDYIEAYKEVSKNDMLEYGIPASITLGQGILESGAGTGPLSMQANNHFGIKCHDWTGPSVKYDDDAEQECFRKYGSPNDSYRDHSLFLASRERYSSLFKLDKDDYKSWAKGLKTAGYATDPAYSTKLISIIEKYQLHRFDAEVLGKEYVSVKRDTIEKPKEIVMSSVAIHQVAKGDTLYSISRRYNISIEDLKKKNNISDSGISVGQKLVVK